VESVVVLDVVVPLVKSSSRPGTGVAPHEFLIGTPGAHTGCASDWGTGGATHIFEAGPTNPQP
jgi:hypothetical protein